MCTLTIVPIRAMEGRVLRLAFSRDESRLRSEALLPHRRFFGEREAVMPIDPDSGGTWIAMHNAGIALAVMNVNPAETRVANPRCSRGTIIPKLLGCDALEEMLAIVEAFDIASFAPFRLVLASIDKIHVFEHHGDGVRASRALFPMSPLMFTSSGLGDTLVRQPRQELFQEMVLRAPSASSQDAFHRHRWADRPHLSISMSRSDARTVSFTTIELTDGGGRLAYFADSPHQPIQPQCHVLRFNAVEAACL